MFGGFGGRSDTSGNSRLRRVQQLRAQRQTVRKQQGPARSKKDDDADEGEVFVVSGACTVVCALLIVALGAAMATAFFHVYQPSCFQDAHVPKESTAHLRKLEKDATVTVKTAEKLVQAAAVAADGKPTDSKADTQKLTKQEPVAIALDHAFPPQCTADQMATLKKQLPPGGCVASQDSPWMRLRCSFSMATTCADPIWFREFQAKRTLPAGVKFTAIDVGCNKGYKALELLRLGTKDEQKYNVENWRSQFVNANAVVEDKDTLCTKQAVAVEGSIQQAQVYCVEPVTKNFQALERTKKLTTIGDELYMEQVALDKEARTARIPTTAAIGAEGVGFYNWRAVCARIKMDDPTCEDIRVDAIDPWLDGLRSKDNTHAIAVDQPIHYLGLNLEGYDFQVLEGAVSTLKNVQYMDIQYHWYGGWGSETLQDLLRRLKEQGFACYFAGDHNLWRVTDCWQDHYQHKFFSHMACVNTQIPDVQPLAQQMESLFQQTLTKPLTFGEA